MVAKIVAFSKKYVKNENSEGAFNKKADLKALFTYISQGIGWGWLYRICT